jgi:two-component system alkaline phosphatase synthesis response regulator PhoP
MKHSILLIEDDDGLVFTLSDRLTAEGYDLHTASDGHSGLQLALRQHFDLIVLDVMLPEKTGFEVCRELRRNGVQTPILMLTARGQLDDKITGFKLGADDYMTKPFETLELTARIEAHIRRNTYPSAQTDEVRALHRFGDVTVDVRGMETRRAGVVVEMSAKEFQLLLFLIEHQGTMLSRNDILNNVWGYDSLPTTRTVDTHIAWLRQKLEPNPRQPQYILTIHGSGYKFVGVGGAGVSS